MNLRFVIAAVFALLMGCKKDEEQQPIKKSAVQLLTQKEWKLQGAGFDDNKNLILDANENLLADCQKNNAYVFDISGSGKIFDHAPSCTPAGNELFDWRLLDNDQKIEISSERMEVAKLNEDELELIPDFPGVTVNFILNYGH